MTSRPEMDSNKGRKKKKLRCTCKNKKLSSLMLFLISILIYDVLYVGIRFYRGGCLPKLISDGNDIHDLSTESLSNFGIEEQIQDFEEIATRNTERIKHLQEQCVTSHKRTRKHKRLEFFRKDYVRILTSPRLSLVYCRVNKAASWYIVHTLLDILNCTEETLHRYSDRIRRLPYETKSKAISNAYRFMFVREPYGRLFSTYYNKFYFPKGSWIPMGTEIIRRFRKNPSQDSLKYGHDVTFAELIRYTIEDFEAGNKMDEHIRPMHTNCKPCDFRYDFIGKLETLTSDWNYLAHEWTSKNRTTKIPPNMGENPRSAFGEMNYFHLTLNELHGSNVNIYDLYQRAWNYYQIASVISKHISMPLTKSDNQTISYYSFLQKMISARDQPDVNAIEVKAQNREAMLQAYSTVPLEDLERLKAVVREDCLLFGYNERPEWIFDRNSTRDKSSTFNYFSGLNSNPNS